MAKKIIPYSSVRRKTLKENFFSMPREFIARKSAGYVGFSFDNLKPNSRYKIVLDNNPDRNFEDLTKWTKPSKNSVLDNIDDVDPLRNRAYIKTDQSGSVTFETKVFGTDAASYSAENTFTPPHLASPINARLPDFSEYWNNLGRRDEEDDKARERIRIIEYSDCVDPDPDNEIITTKDDNTEVVPGDIPNSTDDVIQDEIIAGAQLYQTFFVDGKAVKGADCVDITDITLYFRKKPRRDNNRSGIKDPAVKIFLMDVKEDGTPIATSVYRGGTSKVTWSSISASSTAETETVFAFDTPVRVKTNQSYAFGVQLQDPDYILWSNSKGDLLLVDGEKTEKRSSGSTKEHLGDLYEPKSFTKNPLSTAASGELEWSANKNEDLKFDVHINEYTLEDQKVEMCLKNYEWINLINTTTRWAPGELVYKQRPALAGVTSITKGKQFLVNDGSANLATLIDGDKIVLSDSTDVSKVQVFTVDTTTFTPTETKVAVEEISLYTMSGSAIHTVVGVVDEYNVETENLRLIDSSVNPTQYSNNNDFRFAANDVIIGVESFNSGTISALTSVPLSIFRCNFNGAIPSIFDVDTYYNFSIFVDSSNTFSLQTDNTIMYLNAPNHVKGYKSEVLSRSLEVAEAGLANNNFKSANFAINYNYIGENTTTFCSPEFRSDSLFMTMHKFSINNDDSYEHVSTTKSGQVGAALSKAISQKLQLDQDNKAEDVRVIANVHTPVGTSIEFFAKVYNSSDPDSFDDKEWTRLLQISGQDVYDDKDVRYDYHEVEYQLPPFPQTLITLDGNVTTTLDSNIITIDLEAANTGYIDTLEQNQVVKLWSSLFPTNYQLFTIESANTITGEIELQQPIANTNLVGEGFQLDILSEQHTAFKNPDNFNICRYFGYNGEIHDTYDQMAIKIVLLSENENVVPKVNDYRVIGVSA